MKNAFSHWPRKHGFRVELDRQFPSYLTVFEDATLDLNAPHDTHYIFLQEGAATVYYGHTGQLFQLVPGQYAAVPGNASVIVEGKGFGIVISRENFRGYLNIGGPVEYAGRLAYIDGCTDSLLVSPPRLGDPCLNLLYFPQDIDQTMHTHPSDRIGIILSGYGRCIYDNDDGEGGRIKELEPGTIFTIHAGGLHKFQTFTDHDMRVLAYHPDSDFGPDDEQHPMLNRTIVDGVSARYLDDIRTKHPE
jgi:mannose-6-phosphate isomerase-like protein (cupin superfamily)